MTAAFTTALLLLTTLVHANATPKKATKATPVSNVYNTRGIDTTANDDPLAKWNTAIKGFDTKTIKAGTSVGKIVRTGIKGLGTLLPFIVNDGPSVDGIKNKDVKCAGSIIAQAVSGFQSVDYSVKYMVQIINFTDEPLQLVREEVHSGSMHTRPTPTIMPGGNESYIARKTSGTATGAIGAVGYRIGGSNNVVAISISCPYNFNFASNTLALGIYQWDIDEVNKMNGNHIYHEMKKIDKKVNNGESLNFVGPYESVKRKNFYSDTIPLLVNDKAGEYLIRGHMGTSHKPIVKIVLFPTNPNRLAPIL